jgi:hypothetical protein
MSFFDILTSSIKENWYLTGITIVDGFFVNFALIMPSILFFILCCVGIDGTSLIRNWMAMPSFFIDGTS